MTDQEHSKLTSILTKFRESISPTYPFQLIDYILSWTKGEIFLTQKLCQLIEAEKSKIPDDQQEEWVKQLVESKIIDNWDKNIAAEHLCKIQDSFVQNQDLLNLYQQILQGAALVDNTVQQRELHNLRLISFDEQQKITVANPIYERVFNQNWIAQKLNKTDNSKSIIDINHQLESDTNRRKKLKVSTNKSFNSTQDKWAGWIVLGVLGTSILIHFIFPKDNDQKSQNFPSPQPIACSNNDIKKLSYQVNSLALSIKNDKWKTNADLYKDIKHKLNGISNDLQNTNIIDQECKKTLNQTRLDYAISQAKIDNVLEGLQELCKIDDKEIKIFAKSYLEDWRSNRTSTWKNKIENYLQDNSCTLKENN